MIDLIVKRYKNFVIVILLGVGTYYGYKYLKEKSESDLRMLEQKITLQKEKHAAIEELKEKKSYAEGAIKRFIESDAYTLSKMINDLAREARLEITSSRPLYRSGQEKEIFQPVLVAFRTSGTYEMLVKFLNVLEGKGKMVRVSTVRLSRQSQDDSTLSIELEIQGLSVDREKLGI